MKSDFTVAVAALLVAVTPSLNHSHAAESGGGQEAAACETTLPEALDRLDRHLDTIESRLLNRIFTARDRAEEACASGSPEIGESFVEEFVGLLDLALLPAEGPEEGRLTRDRLAEILSSAGYEDLAFRDDTDSELVVIEATDQFGAPVTLQVDPSSGQILRETTRLDPS